MSWVEKFHRFAGAAPDVKQPAAQLGPEGVDVQLEEALKDFKSSIFSWSDAAYHRPRTLAQQVKRRSWRLAVGWALGCMLVAGSASGLMHERQHRREMARVAAEQRAAAQQKEWRERQARASESDEVLLAGVDSDVSRQVPSAMEPLAQLMDEAK
jgi:homoserine acetyltransferase